jgi:hypothetical protein
VGHEGVLLFVAPSRRLSLLWSEITERCVKAGLELSGEKQLSADISACRVQGTHSLVLLSWRALLNEKGGVGGIVWEN